jgi:hypothetical protein
VSRQSEQMRHVGEYVGLILGETERAAHHHAGRMSLLDLALEHAEAWAGQNPPSVHGERGGSSSPTEISETREIRRVSAQARKDVARIPEICRSVEAQLYELYATVRRLTSVVDHSELQETGCKSCARKQKDQHGSEIGGHFAEVHDKAKDRSLCGWCWSVERDSGNLPPVMACHIYHTQAPAHAGRYMAKLGVKAKAS